MIGSEQKKLEVSDQNEKIDGVGEDEEALFSYEEIIRKIEICSLKLENNFIKYCEKYTVISNLNVSVQKLDEKHKAEMLAKLAEKKEENLSVWFDNYKEFLLDMKTLNASIERIVLDKITPKVIALDMINKFMAPFRTYPLFSGEIVKAEFNTLMRQVNDAKQSVMLFTIVINFAKQESFEIEYVKNDKDLVESLNKLPEIVDMQQGHRLFFILYLAKMIYQSLDKKDKEREIDKLIAINKKSLKCTVFQDCQNTEILYDCYLDYIYYMQQNTTDRKKNCESIIKKTFTKNNKNYLPSVLFAWDNIIGYYSDRIIDLGLLETEKVLDEKTLKQIYVLLDKAFNLIEYVNNKITEKRDFSFSDTFCVNIDHFVVLHNYFINRVMPEKVDYFKDGNQKDSNSILKKATDLFEISTKTLILIKIIESFFEFDKNLSSKISQKDLVCFHMNIAESHRFSADSQNIKNLYKKFKCEFNNVALINLNNKLEKLTNENYEEKPRSKAKSKHLVKPPIEIKTIDIDINDIKEKVDKLEFECINPDISKKDLIQKSKDLKARINTSQLIKQFNNLGAEEVDELEGFGVNFDKKMKKITFPSLALLMKLEARIYIYTVIGLYSKREDLNEEKLNKEEFKNALNKALHSIGNIQIGLPFEHTFFVIYLAKNLYSKDSSDESKTMLKNVLSLLNNLIIEYQKIWLVNANFEVCYYSMIHRICNARGNNVAKDEAFANIEARVKSKDGITNTILMCYEVFFKRYKGELEQFFKDAKVAEDLELLDNMVSRIDIFIRVIESKLMEINNTDSQLIVIKEKFCTTLDKIIGFYTSLILNVYKKSIDEITERDENILVKIEQLNVLKGMFVIANSLFNKQNDYIKKIEMLLETSPQKIEFKQQLSCFKKETLDNIKGHKISEGTIDVLQYIDAIVISYEIEKDAIPTNAKNLIEAETKLEKEKKVVHKPLIEQSESNSVPESLPDEGEKIKSEDYKTIYINALKKLNEPFFVYAEIEEDFKRAIEFANEKEDERFAAIGELGLAKLSFESAKRIDSSDFVVIKKSGLDNVISITLNVLSKFEVLNDNHDIRECNKFLGEVYLCYSHLLLNIPLFRNKDGEWIDYIEESLLYYQRIELIAQKVDDDSMRSKAFLGKADYHIMKALRIQPSYFTEYEDQLEAYIKKKDQLTFAKEHAIAAFSFATKIVTTDNILMIEKIELIDVALLTIELLQKSINECKEEIRNKVDWFEQGRELAMQSDNWGKRNPNEPVSRMAQLRRAFIIQYGVDENSNDGWYIGFTQSYNQLSEEVRDLYESCKTIAEGFELQKSVQVSLQTGSIGSAPSNTKISPKGSKTWVEKVNSTCNVRSEEIRKS